jgi:hypothetical protein
MGGNKRRSSLPFNIGFQRRDVTSLIRICRAVQEDSSRF